MKRLELFHPRVFDERDWAKDYYERNLKSIKKFGRRIAALLKKSDFQQGRILDMGCGFGAVAVEIAKMFPAAEIVGIDLSDPLLELGQSLARDAGVENRIAFQKGDVTQVDFAPKTFDLVVNTFMLHIVEEPSAMLNEIERVAKDDGKVFIADLSRNWLGLIDKKLRTALTLDEAKSIIRNSGIREGKYRKGLFWWDYLVGI